MGKKFVALTRSHGKGKMLMARDKIVGVYSNNTYTSWIYTVNTTPEDRGIEVEGSLEEVLELLEEED